MKEVTESVKNSESETVQEEHGNTKLENLRERHREQKLTNREHQREFVLNKARFLEPERKNENYVECDITTLAKTLKIKSQVCSELLNAVMNALLDGKKNISAFLKVDGALQALLRLLSGQNEKFQLIAAQCICNIALGNEKQITQVLKAAESYLMVHLSGRNQYLKEVCAVALGNLSRHNLKNVELLLNQGFLLKIVKLLSEKDPNVETTAIYALTQLIYHGFDALKSEDLETCLLAVLPVFSRRNLSVAFLLSVLSSCKDLHHQFISNRIHSEALKCLLKTLEDGEKEAVYFLRIVSHLSVEDLVAMDFIENENYVVKKCFNHLLRSEKAYLKRECLSWLGNFINHPMEELKLFGVEIIKENIELIQLYTKSWDGFPLEKTVSEMKLEEQ